MQFKRVRMTKRPSWARFSVLYDVGGRVRFFGLTCRVFFIYGMVAQKDSGRGI